DVEYARTGFIEAPSPEGERAVEQAQAAERRATLYLEAGEHAVRTAEAAHAEAVARDEEAERVRLEAEREQNFERLRPLVQRFEAIALELDALVTETEAVVQRDAALAAKLDAAGLDVHVVRAAVGLALGRLFMPPNVRAPELPRQFEIALLRCVEPGTWSDIARRLADARDVFAVDTGAAELADWLWPRFMPAHGAHGAHATRVRAAMTLLGRIEE
ncbi:MAG TPA: hypothetical protein VF989_16830, partial [Polyangiaceae bacterium]